MRASIPATRKAACLLAYTIAIAAASPAPAAEQSAGVTQSYPNRPIRLVAPFPPGGAVDAIARIIGQDLAKSWGQNVVVDNRGGAAGAVGSELVANAPSNGYTLLMGSTSTISVNPALRKLNYNPQRDFVAVSVVGYVPHVLLVHTSIPATNVTSFVAYAKSRSKPLTYGSVGTGSPHHLAGEIFKGMTGLNMVHVPYTGSGPAVTALMGGEVQFLSLDMPAALPQLSGGRVKALGVAAAKRDPVAPELPTVAESGLPGFEISGWYGIFAPLKTPKEIVAKLSSEIARLLKTPETRASLAKIGVNVLGGTPEEVAAFIKRENAKWSKAISDSGTKVD
jgi:tripartite-type tricarboxylate transporter receptor subunit TctC